MEKEIKNLDFYRDPIMLGDRWAIKLVDHYYSQRKKIMAYKGASAVDKKAVAFYEDILIVASRGFWWHYADRKYIDTVLWLLRRLKVGTTVEAEIELFRNFYLRLTYWRRVGMGAKDTMKRLEDRWGV